MTAPGDVVMYGYCVVCVFWQGLHPAAGQDNDKQLLAYITQNKSSFTVLHCIANVSGRVGVG